MCYWRCLLVFDSPPTPLLHTWICLRDAAFQGSDNKHEKQIGHERAALWQHENWVHSRSGAQNNTSAVVPSLLSPCCSQQSTALCWGLPRSVGPLLSSPGSWLEGAVVALFTCLFSSWGSRAVRTAERGSVCPSGCKGPASPLGFSGCPGASPTHTGLQLVLASCSVAA